MRRTFPLLALVIALFVLPRLASAQDPPPTPCPAGQECPMRGDHAAMQAHHAAMMRQHEQAAARIQQLQDGMHAATGEAKVQAIEALLDEMLAQQRAMHEMMMGNHPMMMHHQGMKPEGMEDQKPDAAD